MKVCVVGGGISGLAAARQLARSGHAVTVLEASPRLGGKISSATVADISVDSGAESMLVRAAEGQRNEVRELADELGTTLVAPEPVKAQLLIEGEPRTMPRSLAGVPFRAADLSEILSPQGMQRANQEPVLPAPPLESDLAIGDLIDNRFGPEVTDRLLEPMLGGVYAGDARSLSTAAVAPALWERIHRGGALTTEPPTPRPGGASSPLAGIPGGLHGLLARLVADLSRRGVELCTRATVREMKRVGTGWRLTVGPTIAVETLIYDAVILATAAAPTARLLGDILPAQVSAELTAVRYASVAVLTVLATGLDIRGSGLLVPPGESPTIKAFTHSSRKWGWIRDRLDDSRGPGHELVRISIGRAGQTAQLQLPDEPLVHRTLAEAKAVPGWEGAQIAEWHLQRWGGALPQYGVGHRERVARWRAAVNAVPGLSVCGALWDGVGIAACLRSARAAANALDGSTAALDGSTAALDGSTAGRL